MFSHLLCSFIFFLASISQAYVSLRPGGDGHAGCLKLADRFPKKLFWPQTTTYINESTSKLPLHFPTLSQDAFFTLSFSQVYGRVRAFFLQGVCSDRMVWQTLRQPFQSFVKPILHLLSEAGATCQYQELLRRIPGS